MASKRVAPSKAAMPQDYDVFLSCPSADRQQALGLKAALESRGLQVWWDQERIEDAASIQRSIEEGLARSRILGPGHPDTIFSLNTLLVTLTEQNDHEATNQVLASHPEIARLRMQRKRDGAGKA